MQNRASADQRDWPRVKDRFVPRPPTYIDGVHR
jgi:hypothetical protein